MNGKICLALAAALVTTGTSGTLAQAPAPAPAPAPAEPRSFEVSLTPDKLIYQANDAIVFTVIAAQTCNLTLTLTDAAGQAALLFPNRIEPNNVVEATKEVRIGDGRVVYRLKEKGRQTVTAVCTSANGASGRTQLRVDVD